MDTVYPVHTARWNRAEPNRATLYDQSSDTTEPCWKQPTHGWSAAMVQFSSVVAQFSCVHTHCQRFATGPAQFGSVLACSVNAI